MIVVTSTSSPRAGRGRDRRIEFDRSTQVDLFPVASTLDTDFERAGQVRAEKLTRGNDW